MRGKGKSNLRRAWRSLVLFLGVFVIASVILYNTSDRFSSKASPNFAGFPPDIEGSQPDTTADILTVWADTDASMSGFARETRTSYVPSSYRMILYALPEIAKTLSPIAQVSYYRFASAFSFTNDKITDEQRALMLEAHAADPDILLDPAQYDAAPKASGASVSFASVLNALDLSTPNLILTDMEADGLTQTEEPYKKALERIFKAGRCISVVGMKSAYSGTLYNYKNTGENFYYGMKGDDATQLVISYPLHSHPRPFYAVIIGTSAQCSALRKALLDTYQSECQEKIYGQKKARSNERPGFVQSNSLDYWLNDPFVLVTAIDGEAAEVTGLQGMTEVPALQSMTDVTDPQGITESTGSAWAAIGVPQYTLIKTDSGEEQTASLTLHITPNSSCYADTFQSDDYKVSAVKVQRADPTRLTVADQAPPDAVLLEGRGANRIAWTMDDFADEKSWFGCSAVAKDADGLTVTLTVRLSACDTGLYRITLPIICERDPHMESTRDMTWVDGWSTMASLLPDEIARALKNDEDKNGTVATRTVNLAQQLEWFHLVEASLSGKGSFDVARLTVDFDIQ
jgi:hypothetical protein